MLFILLINGFFTQQLCGMLTVLKQIPTTGTKRAMLFRNYPNLHHVSPQLQTACEEKLQEKGNANIYYPTTKNSCEKLHTHLAQALNTNERLFKNRLEYCRHMTKNPHHMRFSNWCEYMKPTHSLAVGAAVSATAWYLHCDPLFLLNTFFIIPFMVMEHDSRMTTQKAIAHLLSDESPEIIKKEYGAFGELICTLRDKKKRIIEKE